MFKNCDIRNYLKITKLKISVMNDLIYLVALSTFPKFGAKSLHRLKQTFSCFKEAFEADFAALRRAGLEEKIINEFIEARAKINPEHEWERLQKLNIKILTTADAAYPALLKEIYDPPLLLYYMGTMETNADQFPLAVVGSRRVTIYGRQAVSEIVSPLARAGFSIVSGLAIGVDAMAHQATLEAGGRTVAVLGCGLDNIYPTQNQKLGNRIIEQGGAILSEFPLGTPPWRSNFPIRNRIISGISIGTLVIEAAVDSGSLITARSALDQNREVFALPGSIFSPLSAGPNNLIKMGAKTVTTAQDILEALHLEKAEEYAESVKILPDSAEEAKLLEVLNREPQHIDILVKIVALPAPLVCSTLTLMEMKGRVRNLGGMMYVLTR